MDTLLKLNNRITVESLSPNRCVFLVDGLKTTAFVPQDEEFCELIRGLIRDGIKEEDVNSIEKPLHKKRAIVFLEQLKNNGFIDYVITFNSGVKITICPVKKNFKFPAIRGFKSESLTVSPHTFLTFSGNTGVLENALSTFRMHVDSPSLFLEWMLDMHKMPEELLSILIAENFVVPKSADTTNNWEFHDLLFHTRSRLGLINDSSNLGGTYRFKPKNIERHNGFKDYEGKTYFQLDRVSTNEGPIHRDIFEVLQARRSSRSFPDDTVLTLGQIGEFLFHTAKIIDSTHSHGNLDFVRRTFPSAGGIHDLEFYLLINKNDFLPRDLYYYHPQKHGLYQLQADCRYMDEITNNAMVALGSKKYMPPVIIILTSRFQKMSSKYERIAYRNTLVSVGAAFQTMYLTGAAMNLSTCALGSGNPNLFAEAIGVDPLEECAVGEFVIGPSS